MTNVVAHTQRQQTLTLPSKRKTAILVLVSDVYVHIPSYGHHHSSVMIC